MLATPTEVGGGYSFTVYTFLLALSWIFYSEDSEISFYINKSFSHIKIWKGYKCFIFSHYCENRKRGKNTPHYHLNMSVLQNSVVAKLLFIILKQQDWVNNLHLVYFLLSSSLIVTFNINTHFWNNHCYFNGIYQEINTSWVCLINVNFHYIDFICTFYVEISLNLFIYLKVLYISVDFRNNVYSPLPLFYNTLC